MYSFEVFLEFLLNLMVKLQFFRLKSFFMGFKLKGIFFYSLILSRYNLISRLCFSFNEVSVHHCVFFVTFDKLKPGN